MINILLYIRYTIYIILNLKIIFYYPDESKKLFYFMKNDLHKLFYDKDYVFQFDTKDLEKVFSTSANESYLLK